jgi:tungstate transport system permease protein
MPTVALGLVLYLMFSSSGPLGSLNLFLNPLGVSIGQAILITPIIVSFITSAVEAVDPDVKDLAKTLGASETEASFTMLRESTSGVLLAVVAGFNRAIAELGIVLMIGQNLRGRTRVLTTTIALETTRGNIAVSIALAIILLLIVFSISLAANLIQRRLK